MSPDCFRKAYFGNYLQLWDHMPLMSSYYGSLNAAGKTSFEMSIEAAARRYGYSTQCVGRYDIDGFSGILHYLETILGRFDANGDGKLDTNETLNAFPVFQQELIILGASQGLSSTDTGEQQAAFAYIVAKGTLPSGIGGDVDFAWWWLMVGKNGWNVNADRAALYKVIANISPPPTPPATTQCQ